MVSNGDKIKTFMPNLSLRNTLRPQWIITYYCGILLDWCVLSTNEKLTYLVRCASCMFFFIFHFLMMLFQFVQLMICITNMKTVHDIIPNLIWLSGLPLSIATQTRYLLGRKKVLEFFEAWADLEKKINIEKNCKDAGPCIKRARYTLATIYTILWAGIIIAIGYVVVEYSHSSYLLSSQQVFKDSLGIPLITFLHLFDLSLHFIVISLSDVVPAFVFYHAAWGIRTLAEELDQSLAALNNISQVETGDASVQLKESSVFLIGSFSVRLRRTWYRYGLMSKLVRQANCWFGSLMLFDHGVKFFLCCTMFYTALYNFSTDSLKSGVYMGNMLAFGIHMVSCNLLASQLYIASSSVRIKLASILNENWDSMDKASRDIMLAFLDQVQQDELAACPLGLYKVTPSILLTILSLILSYVIVLIQTK